jgi:glycogen operon protein
MLNAYWEPLAFTLPHGTEEPYRWQRLVDTALRSPDDFSPLESAPFVSDGAYEVQPRSCVVLAAQFATTRGADQEVLQ